MNTIPRWISANPIKSAAFFFVLGGLPSYAAAREDIAPIVGAIFLAVLTVWMAYVWAWDRRALCVVLGALVALPAGAQEERPNVQATGLGGVIIGGGCLLAGGTFCFWFWRTCQKVFGPKPAPTNAAPDEISGINTNTYGAFAWLDVAPDYCIEAASHGPERHWQIEFIADEVPRMVSIREVPRLELMDRAEFSQSLRDAGFALEAPSSFVRDGIPIPESESPLRLSSSGTWTLAALPLNPTFALESSVDGIHWEHVVTLEVPLGSRVRIHEARNDVALFYRARRDEL